MAKEPAQRPNFDTIATIADEEFQSVLARYQQSVDQTTQSMQSQMVQSQPLYHNQ